MAVVDYVVGSNSDIVNKVENAAKAGVKFTACKNSLVSNNIEENNISTVITVAPAGVTELIIRQAEG